MSSALTADQARISITYPVPPHHHDFSWLTFLIAPLIHSSSFLKCSIIYSKQLFFFSTHCSVIKHNSWAGVAPERLRLSPRTGSRRRRPQTGRSEGVGVRGKGRVMWGGGGGATLPMKTTPCGIDATLTRVEVIHLHACSLFSRSSTTFLDALMTTKLNNSIIGRHLHI